MRPNVKSYRGVAEIARNVGAQPQFEINVSDSIEGDKCVSHYLRLSPQEYEIVLRDDNIPQYVGPEAPDYGGQKRHKDQNCCGSGKNSFCVTPDGFLIPCCAFHLELGNLKNNGLSEILKSPELKKWQATTMSDYEECGQHYYCDYCNSVECPYRISDAAFMDREQIMHYVSGWEKMNEFGANKYYDIAANILIRNLRIMHDNKILHNALTSQNYTWALELLDFELSCSPSNPYDNEEYKRCVLLLFSREIIHVYQIILDIAGILREKPDFRYIDNLFSKYGFKI